MGKFLRQIELKSRAEHKLIVISALISLFMLILDQWSKAFVVSRFAKYESVELIPSLFSFTYVTNKGAAWSILEGQIWFFLLTAVVMTVGIVLFFRHLTAGWSERYIAIGLMLSGIIGNAIDRVCRGEVVDFFDAYIILNGAERHWPIFNVADVAICIGVSIFILSTLIRPSEPKQTPP